MDRPKTDLTLKKDIRRFVLNRNKRETGSYSDYSYNGICFPEFYHDEADRYAEKKTRMCRILIPVAQLLILFLPLGLWDVIVFDRFRLIYVITLLVEILLSCLEGVLRRKALSEYFYQAYFDRQNEVH